MRMGAREIFWGGTGGQTDLPYDAEIEYLESTGTQTIATGVVGASEWHITAQGTAAPTANNYLIATKHASGSYWGAIISYNYWAVGSWDTMQSSLPFTSLGDFVVTFTSSAVGFTTGSETITLNRAPDFSVDFHLFSSNNDGFFAKARIFRCKVYQNGVLVRDYIPVRKGSVGALYDRRGVGGMDPDGSPRNDGMYYNVGTGAFQYGQDVVPVEYIEGTGTQWIDTGVVPNTNTKAQIKVYNVDSTGSVIFGYCKTSDSRDWRLFNFAEKVYFDSYSLRIEGSSFTPGSWRELELGNYYVKDLATGTMLVSGSYHAFTGESSIKLNYAEDIGAASKNRWGYVKIYDGDTLIRDMEAVRVGSEGAMMDRLTRIVYRNRGSGAFDVGADVTPHGRLPAGYTEVQWLSTQAYGGAFSSGNGAYTTVPVPQAIAQSQVKVEAHAVDTDTAGTIGQWNILVDTLTRDNTPNYGMNIRRRGNLYAMCVVPGYDSYDISYTCGVPMRVVWDRGTFSVEQNGEVSSRTITAKTTASGNALSIGGAVWAVPESSYGARFWPGLIGEITVSVSDVEIVHLVPCRNPDGVYGLYDLVGNGFYSSLTATPFAGVSLS